MDRADFGALVACKAPNAFEDPVTLARNPEENRFGFLQLRISIDS
jgi:hypothetical protein